MAIAAASNNKEKKNVRGVTIILGYTCPYTKGWTRERGVDGAFSLWEGRVHRAQLIERVYLDADSGHLVSNRETALACSSARPHCERAREEWLLRCDAGAATGRRRANNGMVSDWIRRDDLRSPFRHRRGQTREVGGNEGGFVNFVKRFSLQAALICLLLAGCAGVSITTGGSSTPIAGGSPAPGVAPTWGVQTRTSGCAAQGALQDSGCTPGDILSGVTKDQICRSGYASSVRDVTTSTKNRVYAEYGITHHTTGQYEVDHLVSLELGGSNDISNLWPEAASPRPGFHEKDKVENYLHDQVCSGVIALARAQVEVATNWLEIYNKMPSSER